MFSRTVIKRFANSLAGLNPRITGVRQHSAYIDGEYQRTTMTPLNPEEGYSLQITGYNNQGFYINGKIMACGPIVIFPKSIYSWNVEDEKEINEKSLSLFAAIEPRVDILIIGVGDKQIRLDPELPKWLIRNKITNFEILPTEQAINTFNFVVGENRFVAACLIPAETVKAQEKEAKVAIENAEVLEELEDKKPEPAKTTFERLKEARAQIEATEQPKTQIEQPKEKPKK